MLVSEKTDERGKEREVTKCLFVVPGAVENHSSQRQEALTGSAGASPEIRSTSVLYLLRDMMCPDLCSGNSLSLKPGKVLKEIKLLQPE